VVIKYKVLILTTFLVIVADQGSKIYIDHAFPLEEGRKIVAVVPNYINITHVRNPGAAFGMLAGSNKKFRGPFFLATSILATTIILLVLYRLPPGKSSTAFFLSLILGGAVGNVIDRLRFGEVIDFLDFHWRHLHWPTFNVADIGISVGVILLLIQMVFFADEGVK